MKYNNRSFINSYNNSFYNNDFDDYDDYDDNDYNCYIHSSKESMKSRRPKKSQW